MKKQTNPQNRWSRKTVLVTGANGYLGSAFSNAISGGPWDVVRGRRFLPQHREQSWLSYGDLGTTRFEADQLKTISHVIHFAGQAHVGPTPEAIAVARTSNVEGTRQLVKASAKAGVKRFIFISSALVLEGSTNVAGWIDDLSNIAPTSVYGQLKAEAEEIVRDVAEANRMEWVIVRPPMVYGPGSPGNLGRLIRLVLRGLPLPLATATAPKSFIFVENLISALTVLLEHPAALNQKFLVADNEIISTAQLIKLIAECREQPTRMFPCPQSLLRFVVNFAKQGRDVDRLFKPLAVDAWRIKRLTGWHPPYATLEGVRATLQREAAQASC